MSDPVQPNEPPKPAAAAPPQPEPVAPGLGEAFELSLTALVNAPGVFAKLAARPAPGPGASLVIALAWGAAFFALNLTHVAIAHPDALSSRPLWQIGVVAAAGGAIWLALYLLSSALLYALGRMLGSGGDFDRALAVAAFAAGAAPVQALCNWLPAAWFLPTVLAAWIAACGLHALFKADAWAARGVGAVFAAGLLAAQYGAGQMAEQYAATLKLAAAAATAAPAAGQLLELQKQLQPVQPGAPETPDALPNAAPGQSSLDLLRLPADDGEPAPRPAPTVQQIQKLTAQGEAMTQNVAGMLDTLAPMLDDPALLRTMTPQQRVEMGELKKMMLELKGDMASHKRLTPQEQQAQITRVQQTFMRLMSSGMTMPKMEAAPQAPAPAAAK